MGNQRRFAFTFSGVASAVVLVAGCQGHHTASTYTKMRIDEMRCNPPQHLRDMSDNALLQDMCLADFHFVGRTEELSGTGAARLDRMAQLLDAYGGTIHYDTSLTDSALVDRRLANVREYLSLTGCRMDNVKVEPGLSGERSAPAKEAILAADRGNSGKGKSPTGPMPTPAAPPGPTP